MRRRCCSHSKWRCTCCICCKVNFFVVLILVIFLLYVFDFFHKSRGLISSADIDGDGMSDFVVHSTCGLASLRSDGVVRKIKFRVLFFLNEILINKLNRVALNY